MLLRLLPRALPAAARVRPALTTRARGLAGPVSVQVTELVDVIGPAEVERTEAKLEMGVLYQPGVPSPMESVLAKPPIIVKGTMAKTGGGPTGHPIEYIQLSAFDPTPVACKYSGMEFVASKGAALPEGAWPLGGPKDVASHKPTPGSPSLKTISNATYGQGAEDERKY